MSDNFNPSELSIELSVEKGNLVVRLWHQDEWESGIVSEATLSLEWLASELPPPPSAD